MAIRLLESFDDGLWDKRLPANTISGQISPSYGRTGNGVRLGDLYSSYFYVPIDGGVADHYYGFDLKVNTPASGDGILAYFGSSDYNVLLYDNANARLVFRYRYNSVSEAYVNGTPGSFLKGDWHYVELRVTANTFSAGYVEIHIDGALDASTGPVDFYVNQVAALFGGTSADVVDDFYLDNFYYLDNTGGVNDDVLGPIDIHAVLPDGNGTYSNLVGQDADSTDNYLNVDEATPDDGTTYNQSDTEGDEDTYTMDDLTGTPDVVGVVLSMNAAKVGGAAKYLRARSYINSTDYNGTSKALATSYGLHEEVYDQNPNTSTAWTYTTFNGAEFGVEVRNS